MRTVRNAPRLLVVLLLAAVAAVAVAGRADVVLDALLQRPHQAQGTAIVPDTAIFARRRSVEAYCTCHALTGSSASICGRSTGRQASTAPRARRTVAGAV